MNKQGILYLVATPIGNLEDITLRALRILAEVDIIAAEDTRVTRKLLTHYNIHSPLTIFNEHSDDTKIAKLISFLSEGKNIAVVSDAGTPGISDPGHNLVKQAIKNNIKVEPVPGACAVIAGLTASGLSTNKFVFDGFPPRKTGERKAYFTALANECRTVCLYESPLRLIKTLNCILECMGNRKIAIAREITKLYEEIFRGSVAGAIERFETEKPKGEIVIIIEEAATVLKPTEEEMHEAAETRLKELCAKGCTVRDAVRLCSKELSLPRKQVYDIALRQTDKNNL